MGVEERVSDLVTPLVVSLGLEVWDVEFEGGILRLTVDQADGGVTTDQLVEVNQAISPLLDLEDPVPGRYTLEVSSPGLVRKLRKPDHFVRAVGDQVVVKQSPGLEPRRVRGELVAADEAGITVEAVEIDGIDQVETSTVTVAYHDVTSAKTHFDWGPTPKPGRSQGKRSARRSTT